MSSFALRFLSLGLLAVGCRSAPSAGSGPEAGASTSRAPLPPARSGPLLGPDLLRLPPPSGFALAILRGQGLGPIRFGATRETVERHMAAPCDEATESRCRYVARAVDFELEGGVVVAMVVHRAGRPAGGGRYFGHFNGRFVEGARMLMTPAAVQRELGLPMRVERLEPRSVEEPAERHYYDGAVLEYDRIEPPELALAQVRLTPVRPVAAGSSSAAAPPPASAKP